MRGSRIWILLAVLALIAAACGDGGDEGATGEGEDDTAATDEGVPDDEPDDDPDAGTDEGGDDAGEDGDEAAASGEAWEEPLTIYIPTPPGGGFDIAVRAMQPHIADAIGNDIIPENLEGAGGAVAAEQMLSEPAEGNSMLVTSRTVMSLPYTGTPELDPLNDLMPVGVTHEDVAALSVAADAPYDTVDEFIEHAQENPVTVATSGEGGVWHAAGVTLEDALDLDFDYIPYDGGSPAGQAVVSGEVDAVTIGAPETLPFIESGDMKMLAVMGDERVDLYPDVPTFEEEGYGDALYSVWRGFLVHGDTPANVRDELAARIEEAVNTEESVAAMEDAGFVPTWEGPEQFQQHMEEEDQLFQEIFADTGVIVSEPER